ncbi:bifunctional 4-hydroxy-2-oxoglutarate aldolase/2-dehydro-3-deoxy-phosphogluconate aldolase [Planctomicrobium sp. SH664]|uniref:bifunctional 4-hydroxy-2-oxoglutarate aldolase/2-dehydro-3-deoxy-phosphogluconate aldolase n=1 Tax=Planctomicrobium sp. SH664 TaxID=3448125 RepID=UPI003F5BFCFE
MPKESDLQRVLNSGIVSIIRAPDGAQLVKVSEALLAGGIDVIEVTFTVPRALEIISQISKELGNKILLGAGTVLDPETARAAILAGAEFIVTPVVNVEVIKLCQRYGKVCMSGAFTPTEILTAWEAGADIVKVFPADIGGPNYLKAVHGPLPQVRLLPTGGVDLNTLGDFVKAGACAVGLGTALVEKEALAKGDMQRIQSRAEAFVAKMKEARAK